MLCLISTLCALMAPNPGPDATYRNIVANTPRCAGICVIFGAEDYWQQYPARRHRP